MQCVKYKGAMKIDIWRVLVLYRYGGIYTDIDNEPIDFNETFPIRADDEFFCISDAWDRPSQWFFAMEKSHPVGYFTMLEIFKRLAKLENVGNPKLVFVTGPDALKHGYGNALGNPWPKDLWKTGVHKSSISNKTVTKLGKREGKNIVRTIDMGRIVPWNETENITVRERIERESGVVHWSYQVARGKKNFKGSCLELIGQNGYVNITNISESNSQRPMG